MLSWPKRRSLGSRRPERRRVTVAAARDGRLVFFVTGCDLKADQVKRDIDHSLDTIETNLKTLRSDVETFNTQLDSIARECIEARRKTLLANQNLVASLGFQIRERDDTPKTFTAPQVRRKIVTAGPVMRVVRRRCPIYSHVSSDAPSKDR